MVLDHAAHVYASVTCNNSEQADDCRPSDHILWWYTTLIITVCAESSQDPKFLRLRNKTEASLVDLGGAFLSVLNGYCLSGNSLDYEQAKTNFLRLSDGALFHP